MHIPRPRSEQPIPDHAQKVFQGVIFDVYQWEQEMFDGSTATFEKIKRADTVVVYGVLDDGRILLTEQEQPGKPPFMGAAGGRLDPGEEPLAAAKRELLEETGYEASEWILWNAQQPASKTDWAVYTFIAKGLKKADDLRLDAGERIVMKPVSFDELLLVATGRGFVEKEMVSEFYEARLDAKKKEELQVLFRPL